MAEVRVPKQQKCIAILWPSFMVAVVATGLFFSAFDPDDLYPFGEQTEVSRLGIYSIGFLLFWLISAISGIGTLYFAITNCMRQKPDPK
ncbi:MAG: hypothetical protein KAJ65_03165 [Gammaproteobacteria bacterium]|jgi:hypothetical protein|nr:hypothetical protein [Gammaproteobacteria bacterium]